MALSLTPIQVANFQILKSNFEVYNLEDTTHAENVISFQFDASDLIDGDEGHKNLEAVLAVQSMPQDGSEAAFTFEVRARGFFVGTYFEENGTMEDFLLYMKVNACSLLYGFIRSHIQQISSMAPTKQINLPCIDVQSIARNLIEEPQEDKESNE